jgi:hypothetical protein
MTDLFSKQNRLDVLQPIQNHREIHQTIRHIEVRKQFDHSGDSLESLATPLDILRRQTQMMIHTNFEDGINILTEIGEIKIDLNDNRTRQRVAFRHGRIWTESIIIKSFNELADLVGTSLDVDTSSIDQARESIIQKMMANF